MIALDIIDPSWGLILLLRTSMSLLTSPSTQS